MTDSDILSDYEAQENDKVKIIKTALDYLLSEMDNDENQLSYLISGQNIVLSEEQVKKLKKNFILVLFKYFPKEGSIELWTANDKVFDRFQSDAYLRQVMEDSNLPLEVLPAMLNISISKKGVIIEDVMGCQEINLNGGMKK